MDMSGEVSIAAPREAVWRALNDPEILRQCIPGCEEIEKLSDTEMTAKVTAKVGPVKARFGGKLAQIGSRLIDGTARKMADDFFAAFANLVTAAAAPPAAAPAAGEAAATAPPAPAAPTFVATPHAPAAPTRAGLAPWVWVAGLIVIVLILLAIFGLR